MLQTEFEFTLPKGYLEDDGTVHRKGVMRLSRAMDEIVPLRDPRVKSNPAYATVLILSRVILSLGALDEVTPRVVEDFFTCDLDYLQTFYRQINELSPPVSASTVPMPPVESSTTVTNTMEVDGQSARSPQVLQSERSPQISQGNQTSSQFSSDNPISMDDYIRSGEGPPVVPPSPRARSTTSQS